MCLIDLSCNIPLKTQLSYQFASKFGKLAGSAKRYPIRVHHQSKFIISIAIFERQGNYLKTKTFNHTIINQMVRDLGNRPSSVI